MTGAGKKISAARVRAKLTSRQLAEKAGVSHSWMRSVETGKIAKPDAAALVRVAGIIGLDGRELLALTDQLGAAEFVTPPGDTDLAAAVREMAAAIREQTIAIRAGFVSIELQTSDRAAAITDMLSGIEARLRVGLPLAGNAVGGTRQESRPARTKQGLPALPRARRGQGRPGWDEAPDPEVQESRSA